MGLAIKQLVDGQLKIGVLFTTLKKYNIIHGVNSTILVYLSGQKRCIDG
ncbi:hypothetical protein HMPREF0758_3903 [Serratia odorifera DSM 4582]|uniref:Uncharacterized protein n=1 Tax=Serratia odorifera DSM 4582 TaxID=667129 RepID=D4E6V3_SEROD|nr:hypothetical protein HMPREF0758_3903 [Serratia odorifera DSM 4582]